MTSKEILEALTLELSKVLGPLSDETTVVDVVAEYHGHAGISVNLKTESSS